MYIVKVFSDTTNNEPLFIEAKTPDKVKSILDDWHDKICEVHKKIEWNYEEEYKNSLYEVCKNCARFRNVKGKGKYKTYCSVWDIYNSEKTYDCGCKFFTYLDIYDYYVGDE